MLWVRDMERALAFYRDLLGLEVMSPPDMRGARFLKAGEPALSCPQQIVPVPLPSEAMSFPRAREQRPLHHLGFEVAPEEFDAWRARLEAQGLSPRFGEHPFLPLRSMYLDDPDGNEAELIAGKGEVAHP